jgi:hypothetical protein
VPAMRSSGDRVICLPAARVADSRRPARRPAPLCECPRSFGRANGVAGNLRGVYPCPAARRTASRC